jgi:hypothetical protein
MCKYLSEAATKANFKRLLSDCLPLRLRLGRSGVSGTASGGLQPENPGLLETCLQNAVSACRQRSSFQLAAHSLKRSRIILLKPDAMRLRLSLPALQYVWHVTF